MSTPEVFVTNFNKNFTGVSATASNVLGVQRKDMNVALVGHALPSCDAPLSKKQALRLSKVAPAGKPFSIWHVRRNPEMRLAIWARDILRLPIKIVFTSAAIRRHSAYPRWLISKMDAVIATSKEAASFVPNVWAVANHGVDCVRFQPAKNKQAEWASLGYGGARGIACVGRVRPEKGTDIFVDAMIACLPNLPNTVALVVGQAQSKHAGFLAELKAKVAQADLADRIVFTGEVGADKMPALMRAISLLVALPRYEGFGMTPLEAMACGASFVASDTGYFRAFSNDESFGTIVPLEAADAAASAVTDWLADDDKLTGMATDIALFVQQNYSVDKEAAIIGQVYDRLYCDR
ncbi:MAG: lipopolysaccharide biosynthesis protein [Rhodobacteraceae bacterium]|nr:MAG: lipopolysaccharide biosynthesis protein [Paracoccaceae bacterium]